MRVLILGFDSFDPAIFERLASEGKMPHLNKFVEAGKYRRFEVSDPPQTEVSWTSIATGLDPGGHGIFDFVHRDPTSYTPFVSLLPTERSALGIQFKPPHRTRTIFEEATRMGYPATSMWWPATFPARLELPVRTIPGLGTPDILGKLGVGALYTSNGEIVNLNGKTPVKLLNANNSSYTGQIDGPLRKKGDQTMASVVDFGLEISNGGAGRINIGGNSIELAEGKWSPIFEIVFKIGFMMSIRCWCRAILTQAEPFIKLYLMPLQIHPLSTPWRYGTPPGFIKDTVKNHGEYLTIGWPQDTTGLEEDCFNDDQFMELCESIHDHREKVLFYHLNTFKEGMIGIVFDSLDRIQHMFRRDRPDLIENWYVKLDSLVGRVEQQLLKPGSPETNLVILSDHGFADFDHKVHLNQWLAENDYLFLKKPGLEGKLENVDWGRSQAYAVGLNSLYINQREREGKGIVSAEDIGRLIEKICRQLLEWRDTNGQNVIQRVMKRDEIYSGPFSSLGPDILIGYSPGYRASQETGLGNWGNSSLEPNKDHWSGDHCIDSKAVPGVIFCSKGFDGIENISFRSIPMLTIEKELDHPGGKPPSPPKKLEDREKEAMEERLKSLGYL